MWHIVVNSQLFWIFLTKTTINLSNLCDVSWSWHFVKLVRQFKFLYRKYTKNLSEYIQLKWLFCWSHILSIYACSYKPNSNKNDHFYSEYENMKPNKIFKEFQYIPHKIATFDASTSNWKATKSQNYEHTLKFPSQFRKHTSAYKIFKCCSISVYLTHFTLSVSLCNFRFVNFDASCNIYYL